MPDPQPPPALAEIARRLDELVALFEQHPHPQVRERALELLGLVDALHRPGISALADLLGRWDEALYAEAAAHPAIRMLFVLYDLVPHPLTGESAPRPGSFVPLAELTRELDPDHGS